MEDFKSDDPINVRGAISKFNPKIIRSIRPAEKDKRSLLEQRTRKKSMRNDRMFTQIAKMLIQDFEAKKGGFARLHPEISLAA